MDPLAVEVRLVLPRWCGFGGRALVFSLYSDPQLSPCNPGGKDFLEGRLGSIFMQMTWDEVTAVTNLHLERIPGTALNSLSGNFLLEKMRETERLLRLNRELWARNVSEHTARAEVSASGRGNGFPHGSRTHHSGRCSGRCPCPAGAPLLSWCVCPQLLGQFPNQPPC